jgi:hypothetical protein
VLTSPFTPLKPPASPLHFGSVDKQTKGCIESINEEIQSWESKQKERDFYLKARNGTQEIENNNKQGPRAKRKKHN